MKMNLIDPDMYKGVGLIVAAPPKLMVPERDPNIFIPPPDLDKD